MNSISKDIRDFLLADTKLAEVGQLVFNYRVEQSFAGKFPAIVFDIDLPVPSNTLEENTFNADLWTTKLSIIAISQSPDKTLELAGYVRDLFHYHSGAIGTHTFKNIVLQGHSKIYELEPEMFASQVDFLMYSHTAPQFTTTS